MGHGHFSPDATRRRFDKIVDYRGNHVDIDPENPTHELTRKRDAIQNAFTESYGFKARSEWISEYEKVIAETSHGVELREIHHPTGTTIYYYLVVVKDTEWGAVNQTNLAMQHLPTYYSTLKELLSKYYGDVYRKTSAYTSKTVEVDA